jgi:hypothetical protein
MKDELAFTVVRIVGGLTALAERRSGLFCEWPDRREGWWTTAECGNGRGALLGRPSRVHLDALLRNANQRL